MDCWISDAALSSTVERVITKFEKNFVDEVVDKGSKFFPEDYVKTIMACMQCGTCVGSCPSGRRTSWNIRQIFLKTQRGLRDDVLKDQDLWNCTTCYTCHERCPRQVKTTDLVRVLRNIAVSEGHMLDRHVMVCNLLLQHGHAVPINDKIKAVRKKLGMDEVPPTVHKHPDSLKEVNRILEETGFIKLIKKEG